MAVEVIGREVRRRRSHSAYQRIVARSAEVYEDLCQMPVDQLHSDAIRAKAQALAPLIFQPYHQTQSRSHPSPSNPIQIRSLS
ncbi:hypothetical protein [Microcoleus sp. B9-D4]|uniref:hypothetical protein n=1 Tax=Microcoleus sp. B9-D4 TaxID=2818711 RepID=UPI002FD750DA